VLAIANIMQAVPSIALLGFLIPILGIGIKPAIVMIVIYSLLPIIKNTATGLGNINQDLLGAAKGIGMTPFQILLKVKIPLALPVIMAGVRISAVASVGLVTLAAFIGADGLGYLVYAGIRTVNNYQILAGAIPACIMALLIDWYMGKVEVAVTPVSLQDKEEITSEVIQKQKKQKRNILTISVVFIIFMLVFSLLPLLKQKEKTIVLGVKNFTEPEIIAEMIDLLIEENTDINVELKKGLGSTATIIGALQEGSLDMSFDYTGTIYGSIMGEDTPLPPDEVFRIADQYLKDTYAFEALPPLGFNNTYVFAVRKDTAKKYNIQSMSDLAQVSNQLILGCTIEFMNRPDGLTGVMQEYLFDFMSVEAIDDSPRYIALQNDNVQIIDAYSTDSLIKKYDLFPVEDDKSFFPPYQGFPIITQKALRAYPEIKETLQLLANTITDEQMAEMNYLVDEMGESARDVAFDFLVSSEILKKN
ncbi:MAG: ABC transporter permease subunit, partial [Clostridiales bacterium]|nr:ABC transporter permease subunit [Clostridiales bacterium]